MLRCFFISLFSLFLSFRHDTLAGKWHHRQISLPLPEFRSLVYTRERIEGENSRKGDYTRYPFDDLRGCSPTCFPRNLQRYSMFKGLTRASFFFLSSKRENDKIIFERNCADIGTIGIFIRKCRGISSNFRI